MMPSNGIGNKCKTGAHDSQFDAEYIVFGAYGHRATVLRQAMQTMPGGDGVFISLAQLVESRPGKVVAVLP